MVAPEGQVEKASDEQSSKKAEHCRPFHFRVMTTRRPLKIGAFLASGLVLFSLVLLFVLDYRSNYPYVSFSSFSTVKQFLAFKKNIVKSYLYNWTKGIRLSRSGGRVGIDIVDPTDPKAVEFRKSARLDSVLEGAQTEFDKAVRLREWVHSKIWPLVLSPLPGGDTKNGFNLLEHAGNGSQLLCGQAADLYAQALGSVGLIGREVIANGHVTAEVWSSEHQKWVIMDALYNTHYEKDGTPLNFVELMEIFYSSGQPDPMTYRPRFALGNLGKSGPPEQVFKKMLAVIREVYAKKGVTLKGGPKGLPQNSLESLFGTPVGDLTPSAFATYGIGLRSDHLVHQYPVWHLRNYKHMWNYLYWSGSLESQPSNDFQVSNDLEDFYWRPKGPNDER